MSAIAPLAQFRAVAYARYSSEQQRAECGGLMAPIAVWVRRHGEWALVHRCCECGTLKSNRVAGDDSALGGDRPVHECMDRRGTEWKT